MDAKVGIHKKDDFGILPQEEEDKIPFLSVEIPNEFLNYAKDRIPSIYTTDGRNLFEIKNQGHILDKKMMFIMFLSKEQIKKYVKSE